MKYLVLALLIATAFSISTNSRAHTFQADAVNEALEARIQELEIQRYWVGSLLGNTTFFEENLWELQKEYDTDNDFKASPEEFHEMMVDYYDLVGLGIVPTQEETKFVFDENDWDQSGFLEVEELVWFIRHILSDQLAQDSYEIAYLRIETGFLDQYQQVPENKQIADLYIYSLEAHLNEQYQKLAEMKGFIVDLNKLEEELRYQFARADVNGNGKLSLREALPLVYEISEYLDLELPDDGEIVNGFYHTANLLRGDGEVDGEEFGIVAEHFLLPQLVFSYAWQTESVVYVEHAVNWLRAQSYDANGQPAGTAGPADGTTADGSTADGGAAVFLQGLKKQNPGKFDFNKIKNMKGRQNPIRGQRKQ